MDIKSLVKITRRAWSLDILALMHGGVSGRQASLLSASGAGRTAFAQSLSHLVDLELLERNPGHGHPLRPEFQLTQKGVQAAKIAHRIKEATPRRQGLDLLRRAWSVPVLVVCQKPLFFTDIRNKLASITDRSLSQSLRQLQTQHWLQREVDTANRPPRALYRATDAGARISQAVCIAIP